LAIGASAARGYSRRMGLLVARVVPGTRRGPRARCVLRWTRPTDWLGSYGREHYLANRAPYIHNAALNRKKVRLERTRYLIEYFKANPCVDCGERDPIVLEFDHLGEKSFDVGQGISERNWQSVLDEIAKCEVVCANCHRRRTARQRGAVRVLLTEASARDDRAGDGTRTRSSTLEGSRATGNTSPADSG
jgi:hypothetical protein